MQWSDEWLLIRAAALEHGVDPYFIAAIRRAENGGPGREFGVLAVKALTYIEQLTACCATVRNRMVDHPPRYRIRMLRSGVSRLCLTDDWIDWFATRWAPLGAGNDPNSLNRNWSDNAVVWYQRGLQEFTG